MTVQLRYLKMVPLEPLRGSISTGKKPQAACPRCGIRRTVNHSRDNRLCRDCRDPETDPVWHEMMEAVDA